MTRYCTYSYIKDILVDCHDSIFDLLIDNGIVDIKNEPIDVSKLSKTSVLKEKRKILNFLQNHFGLKHTKFPKGQINYWVLRGFSEEYGKEKIKEFSSVYASLSIEGIMKRNSCTENEAKKIIEDRVKRAKETLDKHSDEEKAEINRRKSNSLETMIARYGSIEGTKRYNERINKFKHSYSMDGLIERYGEEKAKEIQKERSKAKSNSLENLIERYGEDIAKEKYEQQCKRKSHAHTIQGYIDRYGFELGTTRFIERQEKFKESWAKIPPKELERIRKLQSTTLKSFRERHGFEKGTSLYIKARKSMHQRASYESLKVFLPLYTELLKRGFDENDILFGYNDKKELVLNEDTTFYYYDFCIKSLKLIVEFNGIMYHPKSIDDKEWRHPFNPSITSEEKYLYDQAKNKFAVDRGYRVITIWEDVDYGANLRYIIDIIETLKDCNEED